MWRKDAHARNGHTSTNEIVCALTSAETSFGSSEVFHTLLGWTQEDDISLYLSYVMVVLNSTSSAFDDVSTF